MASYTSSAYAQVWLPNPNVLGVTPFLLKDAYWGDQQGFGWVTMSGETQPVYTSTQQQRCTLGFGPC
jgi:hypothetical protein